MPICEITGEEVASLHNHHVIPREFGGVNGPTVNISPSLHDAIHRSVNNTRLKASLLMKYTGQIRANVLMLITALETAKHQLDKVEKFQVMITFNINEINNWIRLTNLAEELNLTTNQVAKKLLLKLLK